MKPVNFAVIRHFNQGNAVGGHVITDNFAFSCPIPVAAVEFRVGSETVWLTRDEAIEVGTSLISAGRDA